MTDHELLQEYITTALYFPPINKYVAYGTKKFFWLKYFGLMQTWEIIYKN